MFQVLHACLFAPLYSFPFSQWFVAVLFFYFFLFLLPSIFISGCKVLLFRCTGNSLARGSWTYCGDWPNDSDRVLAHIKYIIFAIISCWNWSVLTALLLETSHWPLGLRAVSSFITFWNRLSLRSSETHSTWHTLVCMDFLQLRTLKLVTPAECCLRVFPFLFCCFLPNCHFAKLVLALWTKFFFKLPMPEHRKLIL